MTQWKSIEPGYSVSECGQVFSELSGRVLKPKHAGKGYLQVCLGRRRYRYVHRLVAEAFCPRDQDKLHVNHIDGNKHNNAASNLEWVTPQENTRHAYRTGLLDGTVCKNQPVTHPRARPVAQFDNRGALIAIHKSVRSASSSSNTDFSTLVGALQGKFKQAGGFTWRYTQ